MQQRDDLCEQFSCDTPPANGGNYADFAYFEFVTCEGRRNKTFGFARAGILSEQNTGRRAPEFVMPLRPGVCRAAKDGCVELAQ